MIYQLHVLEVNLIVLHLKHIEMVDLQHDKQQQKVKVMKQMQQNKNNDLLHVHQQFQFHDDDDQLLNFQMLLSAEELQKVVPVQMLKIL
jgi:hypothetical protein